MGVFEYLNEKYKNVKFRLLDNSIDSLLSIVNLVPSFAGFSLHKDKIRFFTPYWITHLFLLFYIYGVGNLVYQVYFAQVAADFIKSFVNVTLLIFIASNSYWFLTQRPLLRSVLKEMKENDDMARASPEFRDKHDKFISTIKKIVCTFYAINCTNASFVYLPHRSNVDTLDTEFCMTPCVGIRPLTSFPQREICSTILFLEELCIMVTVLNYQALLILFIDHTAAMYRLLSEEMMSFNDPDMDNATVKQKLPGLLQRHALTLSIIKKLKLLYSMPIGINFGSHAVCIALFFYLPLEEWLGFMPILVYCFLVFFLYCYLCQRLVNAAEGFEIAVYSCGWEKFDVKIQKTVYFMLLQAQEKVEILAADIVPVNIYTFATTCQFMFKFVTVMKF